MRTPSGFIIVPARGATPEHILMPMTGGQVKFLVALLGGTSIRHRHDDVDDLHQNLAAALNDITEA
jgi:hypothetical protein